MSNEQDMEIDDATGLPRAFIAAGKLGDNGATYGLIADLRHDGRIDIWAAESVGTETKADKDGDAMLADWRALKKLGSAERNGEDYAANMPTCWAAGGERRLALLLFTGSEHTDPKVEWPTTNTESPST